MMEWYLDNGESCKQTAAHFGYNYPMVTAWIRKYKSAGFDRLVDNRGVEYPVDVQRA